MKLEKTKFISHITVIDPDSNMPVELEVRKCLLSGAMVGVDGSFLEQDVDTVNNPYNEGKLIIPNDEIMP